MRNTRKLYTALILLLFIIAHPHGSGSVHSGNYFAFTHNSDVLSSDQGASWQSIRQGLPERIDPLRITVPDSDSRYLYLTTESQGLFRLDRRDSTWKNISSRDFRRRSIYEKEIQYRKISAFAVDPRESRHLCCATKHSLYQSWDRGKTWQRIHGLSSRNYITSLAVRGKLIIAGTSFNGIYVSQKGTFRQSNRGLPGRPYSGSLTFHDEVTALRWDKSQKTLYAGFASGSGLYRSTNRGTSWEKIELPQNRDPFFQVHDTAETDTITAACLGGKTFVRNGSSSWTPWRGEKISTPVAVAALSMPLSSSSAPHLFVPMEAKKKNLNQARGSGKRAIYTNVYTLRAHLNKHISTIKQSGMNAIVIDMKDDFGRVYFPTTNKTAREIGAAKKPLPVKKILSSLKKNGIYTIARIVVFKDRQLYCSHNSRYAIKDAKTGKPWKGNPREYWVDPHSEFVHRYNIDLARECLALGFDEIQFDYIRFPSDGAVSRCSFPWQKDRATYKSEILADFLFLARSELDAVISTDIYGFNSWYRFGNWIGQDMEVFSRYVDVICPMVYPSHFGKRFYMKGTRALRPYRIVHDGGRRALNITGSAVIRPYLQAFNLMSPTWGPEYILHQARAARESGCSGYTFWNASGKYDTVLKALARK